MSKTAVDILHDYLLRHTVYLGMYSTRVFNRYVSLIDDAVDDLTVKLATRAPGDNTLTAKRMATLLAYIKEVSYELYGDMQSKVADDLREFVKYETEFQVNSILKSYPIEMIVTTPAASQVYAAAMAQPFQGRILKDWWKDQSAGIQKQFESAVRLGFLEGETLPQIGKRLKGVGDISKRQVDTVIRTAINHVSQVARDKTVQENKNLFSHEEWVSTLDGRTSAICRSRDGETYEIGKGPRPPAHFNCRSLRVPVTKSWKQLGLSELYPDDRLNERPYVADTRKLKDIPKSDRDKLIGQTTAKTYNEWLRAQPRYFVEDVLGKTKAKLYLDGGLSLDRFVSPQGKEFDLAQLRRREIDTFNKIGL